MSQRGGRRTGAMALALLFGTTAAALILARRYNLGVPAILVGILGGLPGLYLAWAAFRDSQAPHVLGLAEVADQLAAAVREQWESEAAGRLLNDPYPLPVSWVAADASLADSWEILVRLAATGAGWPFPSSPGTWAPRADELTGDGNRLVDTLTQVPTGRLVVLGEPGSGKTMLMVRLVLDLLASRASGDPVPVLAPLASWNPVEQGLHDWLAARLTIDHPALAAAPRGSGQPSRIAALLKAGLILPILDGLDEMAQETRISAIARINDSLRPGEHLILTCRTEPYREAARSIAGAVRAAAVIQLCPLDAGAVSRYLLDAAGGPLAAARWDPVLATLGTESPTGQALVTPLMVDLAREIYNPRPGERRTELRDPVELYRLSDRAAVESHLFDAFIPAAYRQRPTARWDAQRAETWLIFLARHLENTVGSPDLAWWQVARAMPDVAGLVFGLVGLFAFGLMATPVIGFLAGLLFGLTPAFLFGLVAIAGGEQKPSRGVRISISGLGIGFLGFGLPLGLLALLFAGLKYGLRAGLLSALAFGLSFGILMAWIFTISAQPGDLVRATSPRSILARDRQAALVIGIGAALMMGQVFGIGFWLDSMHVFKAATLSEVRFRIVLAIALVLASSLGLALSSVQTEWLSYALARSWLASHRQLPWSLMGFLADAHQRGILRQVGSAYQFRHIELQRRLASRSGPQSSASQKLHEPPQSHRP
jgi:NACHT domain